MNDGDPSFLLRLASPEVEIVFPGQNSWSTMFRPAEKGRAAHATHRGIDECRAFADRFAAEGLRFEIEDILVNGGPWRTRVAVRAQDYLERPDRDEYSNRVVAFLELRWGKLISWEDYEDTERIAAWDAARSVTAASTGPARSGPSPSVESV